MSDERFPSGPWTGFYNYAPQDKHRMDLDLTFAEGRLSGGGNDDVGRYDARARECDWVKTYPGSHDVSYRGFREGKGIWGTWEIRAGLGGHGGFHIWPKGLSERENESRSTEATAPADAIENEHAPAQVR